MFSKINKESVLKFKDTYDSFPDYSLNIEPKSEINHINELEQKTGFSLPDPLKEFYLTVGSISADDMNEDWILDIYSPLQLLEYLDRKKSDRLHSMGLVDTILFSWGNDRPEFESYFSQESLDYLNNNYKSFGSYMTDCIGEERVYLYFDKEGKFGTVKYHQDDFDGLVDDFLNPMLEESITDKTFDECLSSIFDDMITGLNEMESDEDY